MENIFIRQAGVLLATLLLLPAVARAELKPEWELGAGFAVIDFPVYRGASEHRAYLLPMPHIVYRGDVIQVSQERVRGLIFRSDRVEMDVSLNGSVPAKSSDIAARHNMPDIDPTLELGPSLNVHLLYAEDHKTNLDLRLPLRSAFASDFKSVQQVGWLFQPQLALDLVDIGHSGWRIGLLAGLIFSDVRYNSYFYDVAPQYATATRSAYAASGGYAGTQYLLSFSKRHDGYWTGGFMKWDDLNGAVFSDSPLVTSKQNFTVGFAVTWVLSESGRNVEVGND